MARVLVVDDVETYRHYLKLELEEEGHEVETARNGHDAILIGERFRPDLLVVDWMLKNDHDGLDVSDAIRVNVPEMRTILITGFPSNELRQRATASKIARFVKKPFSLADIVDTVKEVLSDPVVENV